MNDTAQYLKHIIELLAATPDDKLPAVATALRLINFDYVQQSGVFVNVQLYLENGDTDYLITDAIRSQRLLMETMGEQVLVTGWQVVEK